MMAGMPDESRQPTAPGGGPDGPAWLALGFRPFYLAAALFAAVAVPLWLAEYLGWIRPAGLMRGPVWHAHEMIFGFAAAVIAGFLLTAVRNWTGRPTPTGISLGLLAGLWLAGRVLVVTGPWWLAAAVDPAFLLLLGAVVARPILATRNRRNFGVPLILAGLAVANLLFHLALAGSLGTWSGAPLHVVALDVIAVLLALIGGRVIPAFTASGVPGSPPRRVGVLEVLAFGGLIAVLATDLLAGAMPLPGWAVTTLLALTAGVHGLRLALWQPAVTRGNPLLWALPVAYAWLPISLALRAMVPYWPPVLPGLWIHALTVGAIGGLVLAMMTRSSLGHSGRPLRAGAMEIGAYLAVHAAAVLRVFPPLAWPGAYRVWVAASALLWTLAFGLFLVRYIPILTRPRLDGRPG